MSGVMLRLREARPISTDVFFNGTTLGSPGDGSGSVDSWSVYQSGSTQTSATHCSVNGGDGLAPASGTTADGSGGVSGRGIEPVVKS